MLNQEKAPGLDLITARMLKELPKEGLVTLLYIFNAILLLEYWPKYCINNNDIQPGKNSNGHFILRSNQLTTDNFKRTRKAYIQKCQ
jgi:hypothetical protein